MATFGTEGSITHGTLGLQDWPTQSCACGSPLFCSLPSGGRKCSTNPPECARKCLQCNRKTNIRNSPIPPRPSGGREGLLFVSLVTRYHHLSPSPSCMPPFDHVGNLKKKKKPRSEEQIGEATENFLNPSPQFICVCGGDPIGIYYR